jgi:hypothetical protein
MSNSFIISLFASIGVITGTLIGLRQLLRPMKKRVKSMVEWVEDFQRDWSGEPAGPGRDAVPGVMERLNKLDGELSQNGGNSTKDVVNRLDYKFDMLADAFVEMGERLISIEESLSSHSQTLEDHIKNPQNKQ